MIRVLSSACVVLLLLATGGKAWAGGKPTIAVLGLEVYDNGSGIDPETTKAAKELTAALRERVRAGTGPYVPATSGEKELIDEKLLNNCDSEAPPCMAAIGAELSAEALMYGKIEKSSQNGQTIYKVSIKLLNVPRKQLASSTVETLPLAESTGARVSTHAKNWYNKLVGITTGGTVAIKANIDRGTVLVDGDAKGTLTSGSLTLPGIAEGRHTLAVEAPSYQRYETQITVRNDETLQQSVTMVEMSSLPKKTTSASAGESISREGTVGTSSKSNIWKPVFYGTAVVEAGAIGFAVFELLEGKSNARKIDQKGDFARTVGALTNHDCTNKPDKFTEFKSNNPTNLDVKRYEDACTNWKFQKVGWVATGVVGAALIGSFYMAFMRDREPTETRTANGGHKKRRELAITPVITPDGGGATLRFDW
jgi:PEGA domain